MQFFPETAKWSNHTIQPKKISRGESSSNTFYFKPMPYFVSMFSIFLYIRYFYTTIANRIVQEVEITRNIALREKCPYSELFWSSFSRVWTEYEEILGISLYSVRMWKNAEQNATQRWHEEDQDILHYSKNRSTVSEGIRKNKAKRLCVNLFLRFGKPTRTEGNCWSWDLHQRNSLTRDDKRWCH